MTTRSSRLGLGSVQWGLDYGVANRDGIAPAAEVARILTEARSVGIDLIDTAALYGESEAVLGQQQLGRFRIVTKTSKIAGSSVGASDVRTLLQTFKRSLDRLGASSVYGLLVHQADDLMAPGGEHLLEALQALQQAGRVQRIGASIYTGEQIRRLLEHFTPDIVQLPLNVLDQRLIEDGSLSLLKSRGVEVHARSALLQGLLVMAPSEVPAYFEPIRHKLAAWHDACQEQSMSPLQAALGFVCDTEGVDRCLIGVQSLSQLKACLHAVELPGGFLGQGMASNDPAFVNPAQWRLV